MRPEKVKDLLKILDENDRLDFKKENYLWSKPDGMSNDIYNNKKSDFLKDILAFANTRSLESGYILIGVKNIAGESNTVTGLDVKIDDADFQNFVNDKVNRPIKFSFQNIEYQDHTIGIYEIPSQYINGPFYSLNDYGKVRGNTVYVKNGSSTRVLSPAEILSYQTRAEPKISANFFDSENKVIDVMEFSKEIKRIVGDRDYLPYDDIGLGGIKLLNYNSNINYYREYVKYIESNNYKEFSIQLKSDTGYVDDVIYEIIWDPVELEIVRTLPEAPLRQGIGMPNYIPQNINSPINFEPNRGIFEEKMGGLYSSRVVSSEKLFICPKRRTATEVTLNVYSKNAEHFQKSLRVIYNCETYEIDIDDFILMLEKKKNR